MKLTILAAEISVTITELAMIKVFAFVTLVLQAPFANLRTNAVILQLVRIRIVVITVLVIQQTEPVLAKIAFQDSIAKLKTSAVIMTVVTMVSVDPALEIVFVTNVIVAHFAKLKIYVAIKIVEIMVHAIQVTVNASAKLVTREIIAKLLITAA